MPKKPPGDTYCTEFLEQATTIIVSLRTIACSKNSVQYVPPDGFFGIQIAQNSISDPAGGAYDAPQTL